MVKSDNIVKIGTRVKLCKQQSTYRESHDGDGGDWNGLEQRRKSTPALRLKHNSVHLRKHKQLF